MGSRGSGAWGWLRRESLDRRRKEGWRGGETAGLGGRSDRARRKAERCWGQTSQWRGASVQGTPHLDGKVAVPPLSSRGPTAYPNPQRPHPLPSIPPHPPPAGGLRRLSLPRSLCSSSILLPRASGGSETYNPTRPPTRSSSRGLQTPPPPLPTLPSAISPL